MAQSSIHHRQNALWRGLWMLFSCDWTIACTSGKSRPLRNEAWSSDPPKWYIDTLFFTWSAMTGLLECGILYFSTYSKLCKTQYTHITHMQHDTVLFVLNNACLRPRNTGIIAMSWPQKITSSSSELIKLVQLCQLECTAVCNPPREKSLIVSGRVTRSVQSAGDDLVIHHQTPGGASLDYQWSRYI